MMTKIKKQKIPWYQQTMIVVIVSFLGSLLGFATIASLLGIRVDDKLNQDYFISKDNRLFTKKPTNNQHLL